MAARWYLHRLSTAKKAGSNTRGVREVETVGKCKGGVLKRAKGEKKGETERVKRERKIEKKERKEGRGRQHTAKPVARDTRVPSPLETAPGTLIPFNRTPAREDRIPLHPPFLFTTRCTTMHSKPLRGPFVLSYACVCPS